MAKVTNFKFGTRATRESPDMTLEKIFEKGARIPEKKYVAPYIFGC